MASLTIKGLPESLLERLRRAAKQRRRSLNSEVIHRLESSLGSTEVDADAILTRIQRLQDRNELPPLTDEILERAIGEGRS
ncbi:MAG TPA: Arc family DNA-binding protein [Longimicrobiaceae bacterium]|nr:Arc family DNA-binding protein [Longimicrobiaceae bacterium]